MSPRRPKLKTKDVGIVETFLHALKTERTLDFKQVEAERSMLIEKLTRTLNTQEIKELMAKSLAYRTGELRYGDFYSHLKETCRKKEIRLSDYPAMDEYVQYVLLCGGIDAEQLLNEISALEKSAYDALANTLKEKALVAQSRQDWLTSKLVDFGLTPLEWKEYESLLTNKDPSLASFEAFYHEAEARDTAMAKNLLAGMDLQSKFDSHSVALLVTGGFHAEGIGKKLTDRGATVISYVPKIDKVDTAQGSAYLSVFTQEKTPLDKLFQGEKLFLASSPFATHFRSTLAPALVALMGVFLLGQMGRVDVDAIYSTLGGVGSLSVLKVVQDTIRAKIKFKGMVFEFTVKKGSPGIQSVTESIGIEYGRWSAITRFLERQFTRAERINPRQIFKELFFLGPALTQILLGWINDPTMGPLSLFLSSLTPLAITLPVFLLYHGNLFINLLKETPKEQSKWRVAAVYFFYVAIGFVLFGFASTAMFSFALGFISNSPMWNTVLMIIVSLLGSLGLAYNTHRGGNLMFPVPAMATQKEIISSLNDVFDYFENDSQCDYDVMWDTTNRLIQSGFERGVPAEEISGSIRTLANKANGEYRVFVNLLRLNVKDPFLLWSQNKSPAAPIAKGDFTEDNTKTQPVASSQQATDTVPVPKVPDHVVSLNTIISECQIDSNKYVRSRDPRKMKVIEAIDGDKTRDVGHVRLESGQKIKLFRISSGGPTLDAWGMAPEDREPFKACFLLFPPPNSNESAFHHEDFERAYRDGFLIRGNHHITAKEAFFMIGLFLKKTKQEIKNSLTESGVLDRSHIISIGDFSLEVFPRVKWDYTIGQYHRVDSTLIGHILEEILVDIPSLSAEETDLNKGVSEDLLLQIPLAHRMPDMNSPRQITVGDEKLYLRLGAQGLVWAIKKKPIAERAEKVGGRETKKKTWKFHYSIATALEKMGILTDADLARQVLSDWKGLKSKLQRIGVWKTGVVKEWVEAYDYKHYWVKRGNGIRSIQIPDLPLSLPAKALLKGVFKTGDSTTLGDILHCGNLPQLLGLNQGKVFDSLNATKEIFGFLKHVREFEQNTYSSDPLFSEINDAIDLFLKTQANPNNYENLLISVRSLLSKESRAPKLAESYVNLFIKKEADFEDGETNDGEIKNLATPGNPLSKFVPMPITGLGKKVRTFDFASPVMTKLFLMNIHANSDLFDWSPRRDALKDALSRHPGVTEEMIQTVEDWFEKGGPDRVWVSPKHHLWDTPISELPLSKESLKVLFRVRGMTNASTLQDLKDLGSPLHGYLKGALNQEFVTVDVHTEIEEFYRVIFHLYGNLGIRQAVEGYIVGDQSVKDDDKLRKKVIEFVTNSRSNRRAEDGDDRWIRLFRREILEENARFNLSRQRDSYPNLVVREGILERLRESDWNIEKVADEFGITVSEFLESVKSNDPDPSVSDVIGFLKAHSGDVPGMVRLFFRANQEFDFFDVLKGLIINAPILRDCVVSRLKTSGTVAQAATDWGVEISWMRRLVEVVGVESFPAFADMQEYLAMHDGNVAEAQRFFFGGDNRAEAYFFRYIEKRDDFKIGLRDFVLNKLRTSGTKQRMATDWKVGTQWVRSMMALTGIEKFPTGEDYRRYLEANDWNLEACKKFHMPSESFKEFVDKLIADQGVPQFLNEKIRELSGASSSRNALAERLGIGVPSLSYLLSRLDLTELITNSVKKSPAQDLFEEFKDAVEVCGNDTQSLLDLLLVLNGEAIPLAQVKKYVRDFTELHLGDVARRGPGGLGNRDQRMLEFFFKKASLINKKSVEERGMLVSVFLKVLFIELSDEKKGSLLMAQLEEARSKGVFFEELYLAARDLTDRALQYRAPHLLTHLLPHQRVGAFFLSHHARAYLGDGTGLGKTIEALAAMDPQWKVFVAAPASLLDSWQKEIFKHFTREALKGIKIVVLSGDQAKRQRLIDSVRDEKGVIVIGSIQSLRGKTVEDLSGLSHGLDLFVVDESQMGANYRGEGDQRNAQQAEALQKIESSRKWYLSATAYGSNHQQLFAMLHALSRGTPEEDKYRDYNEFCRIHPRNDPLGYRLLRAAMRRVSLSREPDDVMRRFDPPAVHPLAEQGARLPHLREVPYTSMGGYFLNEEQIDLLLRLVKDFGRFAAWYNERVPEEQRLTEEQINPFTKLRFAFDLMINPRRVGGGSDSPMWAELDRVVKSYASSGKKGILFTLNKSVLEAALNRYGRYGVARIDGSITGYAHDQNGIVVKGYFDQSGELVVDALDPRARAVDAKTYQRHLFQTDPKVRIIVVNMKAGGVGLDLTAAEYAVQVQLPDTYTLDRQLDGRMVRVDLRRPHEAVDKIRMVARFPEGWAERYRGTEYEPLAAELSASGTPLEIQLERNEAGERVFRLVMTDLATPEEQDTLMGKSLMSFFPGFQQDKSMERYYSSLRSPAVRKTLELFLPLYERAQSQDQMGQVLELAELYFKTGQIKGLEDLLRTLGSTEESNVGFLSALQRIPNKFARARWMERITYFLGILYTVGKGESIATEMEDFSFLFEEAPYVVFPLYCVLGHANATTEREILASFLSGMDRDMEPKQKGLFYQSLCLWLLHVNGPDAQTTFFSLLRKYLNLFVGPGLDVPHRMDRFEKMLRLLDFPETKEVLLSEEVRADADSFDGGLVRATERAAQRIFNLSQSESVTLCRSFPAVLTALQMAKSLNGNPKYAKEALQLQEVLSQVAKGRFSQWRNRQEGERLNGGNVEFLKANEEFWEIFTKEERVSINGFEIGVAEHQAHLNKVVGQIQELMTQDDYAAIAETVGDWAPKEFLSLSTVDNPGKALSPGRAELAAVLGQVRLGRHLNAFDRSVLARAGVDSHGSSEELTDKIQERLRAYSSLEDWLFLSHWLSRLTASPPSPAQLRNLRLIVSKIIGRATTQGASKVAEHLELFLGTLNQLNERSRYERLSIEFTTNPALLLQRGMLQPRLVDCFNAYANPEQFSTLVDDLGSRNKILAIVRDQNGHILARSVVKVKRMEDGTPVLFPERPLYLGNHDFENEILEALRKSKAKPLAKFKTLLAKEASSLKGGQKIFDTGGYGEREYFEPLFGVRSRDKGAIYHFGETMPSDAVRVPFLGGIGYQGQSVELFLELLKEQGITLVIDVRENAYSQRPDFSSSLRERLGNAGIGYEHQKSLGAPKSIRQLHRHGENDEEFMRQYAGYLDAHRHVVDELVRRIEGQRVALLCYEQDPSQCHRTAIIAALRGRISTDEDIKDLRPPSSTQMDLFGNHHEGKAASTWGLKIAEWLGAKVGGAVGRERFGAAYRQFAAFIEWSVGAKVASWGLVGTLVFSGAPWGWVLAPVLGVIYGVLFFGSHFISKSMAPVTRVNVGVVEAMTMGLIYGVLIGVTPFLLGAVPLWGVPDFGVQAAGVLWGLAGGLHSIFDSEKPREAGERVAWTLVGRMSRVQGVFEVLMPGTEIDHTEQVVGKGSLSVDPMTEILSRLKTDTEFRAGFLGVVQSAVDQQKLSGTPLILLSSLAKAATGQPVNYVHVMGSSASVELNSIEMLLERSGVSEDAGVSVGLVVPAGQSREIQARLSVLAAKGVQLFPVNLSRSGWSADVLDTLDHDMSAWLSKTSATVATVGAGVSIHRRDIASLDENSKLRMALESAVTLGDVVQTFLHYLRVLASNA